MSVTYSTVMVAAAIGVLPVFGWMIFIIREHHVTYAKSDFLLKVFFWGVLSAVPASLLEIYAIESGSESRLHQIAQGIFASKSGVVILGAFLSAAIIATIEEFSKGAAIVLGLLRSKTNSVTSGLVIGMLVGLAFAVTENGVYFASAIGNEKGAELMMIIVLRFVLSTSAHIIYSGGMGILVAEAFRAGDVLTKSVKIAMAIIFPIFIHTIFNFVLSTAYSWLSVIIIALGFVAIWRRYVFVKKAENNS